MLKIKVEYHQVGFPKAKVIASTRWHVRHGLQWEGRYQHSVDLGSQPGSAICLQPGHSTQVVPSLSCTAFSPL